MPPGITPLPAAHLPQHHNDVELQAITPQTSARSSTTQLSTHLQAAEANTAPLPTQRHTTLGAAIAKTILSPKVLYPALCVSGVVGGALLTFDGWQKLRNKTLDEKGNTINKTSDNLAGVFEGAMGGPAMIIAALAYGYLGYRKLTEPSSRPLQDNA